MSSRSDRERERSRAGRDKRQLILDAAIKVFARTGYHGSRVSDIANEAGIAYGLVYHYFKNKEEVLDTIFDEQWSAFLDAVESIAVGGGSTEDKLLSIAALILNAYRARRDWVKVLVFEIQRSPKFHDRHRLDAMGALFGRVARVLADAQAAGELRRDIDPQIASYLFIGGLDIVVTGRVLDVLVVEGDANDESTYYIKVARTIVDLFVNGMRVRGVEGGARSDGHLPGADSLGAPRGGGAEGPEPGSARPRTEDRATEAPRTEDPRAEGATTAGPRETARGGE